MIARFETGKTYTTRSVGDYDCIFSFTVIKRTAKRITLKEYGKDITTRGIYVYDNSECCKPLGEYSMCPVIRADRV